MKEPVKIPDGMPKSGRSWKVKQTVRSSAQLKQGVLSHLAKSFEERDAERQKKQNVKELERELIEERKQKKLAEKTRREEQQKRRQENEYKNSVTQEVTFVLFILQQIAIPHTFFCTTVTVEAREAEGHEQEAAPKRQEDDGEQVRSGGACQSLGRRQREAQGEEVKEVICKLCSQSSVFVVATIVYFVHLY
jgi:hypothetical protein